MQQTTSVDDNFRCIFLGALMVKMQTEVLLARYVKWNDPMSIVLNHLIDSMLK